MNLITAHGNLFRIALRRVLALPFLGPPAVSQLQAGQSVVYLPLAGLCVGLLAAGAYHVLSLVLNEDLTCLVLVGVLLFASGGRRIAGCLAYFKLYFPRSAPALKDAFGFSRREVFAPACLVVLALLKYLGLTHIGEGWIRATWILLPTVSGWTLVYLAHSFSEKVSPDHGEGLAFVRQVGGREFWLATGFVTAVAVGLFGFLGLFLLMAVALWTTMMERTMMEREEKNWELFFEAQMEINEVMLLLAAGAVRKALAMGLGEGITL
jgi:cobalamin synthase